VNGEQFIYSVGPDGQDDHGDPEWNGREEATGDFVIRMKP